MCNLTSDEDEELPLSVTIPGGVVILALIFFAIFGNVMTIAAFVKDKGLRSVYNMYLVNLAVTDLMLGLISMPFYAVHILRSYSWPFGYHFCKIHLVIDFTLCLESILTIIIISLDRLLLLKYGPLYHQRETSKVAIVKISLSWIVAGSLYTPAIIGWDLWTGEDAVEPGDCHIQFAYDLAFTTTTAVIEFVIPFFAIDVINLLIYIKVKSRTKHRTSMNKTDIVKTRKDVKAARFLAMLVIVFGVTWGPYTITTIIISFCESCVNEHLYTVFIWLLWSKASVNPLLYAYNSVRFLKNFKKMLFCQTKTHRNGDSVFSISSKDKTKERTF